MKLFNSTYGPLPSAHTFIFISIHKISSLLCKLNVRQYYYSQPPVQTQCATICLYVCLGAPFCPQMGYQGFAPFLSPSLMSFLSGFCMGPAMPFFTGSSGFKCAIYVVYRSVRSGPKTPLPGARKKWRIFIIQKARRLSYFPIFSTFNPPPSPPPQDGWSLVPLYSVQACRINTSFSAHYQMHKGGKKYSDFFAFLMHSNTLHAEKISKLQKSRYAIAGALIMLIILYTRI